MGMYDSVYLDVRTAQRVLCAHGHPMTEVELQTKDMDLQLQAYFIVNDRLYLRSNQGKTSFHLEDDPPHTRHTCRLKPIDDGMTICVYADCKRCMPVVCERGAGGFGSSVTAKHPWCEWELTIREGVVVEVRPVSLMTRAELIADLRKDIHDRVLPDDDRIAAKVIEQHRLKHEEQAAE